MKIQLKRIIIKKGEGTWPEGEGIRDVIFRVIKRSELERLFSQLADRNTVIGPVESGHDIKGNPIFTFDEVKEFNEVNLDYSTTKFSAKRYFLPYREDLATFHIDQNGWEKTVDYNVDRPHIFFGLHACDINALNKLDKVLMGNVYPMPYYAAKRKNMFIIGINCVPHSTCFCRSMGSDTALHGFDMFITDIGPNYFIEILSDTAFNVLKKIKTAEPHERDHIRYMEKASKKNGLFTTQVDTTDLTKILDMEFQSDVWEQWGEKCLSCGGCASVCPTCYCYGVEEHVSIDLRTASKTKTLYSCNIIDFAEVAGGHNFRKERHVRLKYRFYHQHRGFVEAFEEPLCVGCGRCGDACLAGINVPDVIASIRKGAP